MLQILVVADDFTGALDTGVQFAKQGYRTQVVTGQPPGFFAIDAAAQALVVDTQSRHISACDAYRSVFGWVEAARDAGVPLFYKKTDSTLRGNVGAELDAALAASGRDRLVFIPAFPRLARTVRDGKVFVDGVPLEETVFAKDPFTPVHSSMVAEILGTGTSLPVLIANPDNMHEIIGKSVSRSVIAADAQTDGQLERLAKALYPCRKDCVFAGCAGFAEFITGYLRGPSMTQTDGRKADSMLVVSGSVNAVSLRQAAAAEAAGIYTVRLRPRQYLEEGYLASPGGQSFLARLKKDMAAHRCMVLKTADSPEHVQETIRQAQALGLPPGRLHLTIADRIGNIVARVLEAQPVDVLAVFGGDTLHGIIRNLDCTAILPKKEIFPGIVQSVLRLGGRREQVIVSKAGGFGGEDVATRLMEHYGLTL